MRKMTRWLKTDSTVLWSTVVACAILAVTDVVGSISASGYSVTSETTSQLMSPDVRYSWLVRLGAFAYAVLLIPIAFRISRTSSTGQPWKALAVAGIWAHLALALLVAIFQNDSRSVLAADVTANRVHDVSAILMFAAAIATVLALLIASGFTFRTALSKFSLLAFVTMSATGVVFAFELHTDLNGIYERVIAVTFMIWLIVIASTIKDHPITARERRSASPKTVG